MELLGSTGLIGFKQNHCFGYHSKMPLCVMECGNATVVGRAWKYSQHDESEVKLAFQDCDVGTKLPGLEYGSCTSLAGLRVQSSILDFPGTSV